MRQMGYAIRRCDWVPHLAGKNLRLQWAQPIWNWVVWIGKRLCDVFLKLSSFGPCMNEFQSGYHIIVIKPSCLIWYYCTLLCQKMFQGLWGIAVRIKGLYKLLVSQNTAYIQRKPVLLFPWPHFHSSPKTIDSHTVLQGDQKWPCPSWFIVWTKQAYTTYAW